MRRSKLAGVSGSAAFDLVRRTAAILEALGAEVEIEASLAGIHIDIIVVEATPSGAKVKAAFDIKSSSQPLGVEAMQSFSSTVELLKGRNLVNQGAVVSSGGFTGEAREFADLRGIEIFLYSDLERRAERQGLTAKKLGEEARGEAQTSCGSGETSESDLRSYAF